MADLKEMTLAAADGYHYDPTPQRTPGWYKRREGKVSASRLEDFLSVSKAKNSAGAKLKKRLDYELEIQYERQFKVSYNNYVSDAMLDGQVLETFAISQFEKITGLKVESVGCWYNDNFVASPDGIVGDDAVVEAKVLRDASFSALLAGTIKKGKKATKTTEATEDEHIPAISENGVHSKFWKQMQGQLRASGRKFAWFIAINTNTKKIYMLRVERDETFMEWLDLNLTEIISEETKAFETKNVFDFRDEAPEVNETDGESFHFN